MWTVSPSEIEVACGGRFFWELDSLLLQVVDFWLVKWLGVLCRGGLRFGIWLVPGLRTILF